MGDSLEVIDRVLKRDLPQGPGWRRHNHDGYGQKDDGSAFDGTGVGRSWPILTGERGHYELAAGRDPMPFIVAMEKFANAGGMISEQLWDADDLPNARMKRGLPTGAAMPLCCNRTSVMRKNIKNERDEDHNQNCRCRAKAYANGRIFAHRPDDWAFHAHAR